MSLTKSPLSTAQLAALEFSQRQPLRDGGAEQQIDIGLCGAALDAVIGSLERRGFVNAEGWITPEGELLLERHYL